MQHLNEKKIEEIEEEEEEKELLIRSEQQQQQQQQDIDAVLHHMMRLIRIALENGNRARLFPMPIRHGVKKIWEDYELRICSIWMRLRLRRLRKKNKNKSC